MTNLDLAPGPNPTHACHKSKSRSTTSGLPDLALPEESTKLCFAYPGKTWLRGVCAIEKENSEGIIGRVIIYDCGYLT